MLLTFAEAKDSQELADVSAVCSDTTQFRSYLNQATRKLMRRGNWFGTVQKVRVCIYNNCITWPRFVGTTLATNFCGKQSRGGNFWYDFLPMGGENWKGILSDYRSGRCHGNLVHENSGLSPVFNNIPCGQLFYVRAYPAYKQDAGKTITIFGVDNNGQTIMTKRSDGTYQEGVVLTLAVPFAVTPTTLQKIDRVLKDATMGPVRLYLYDSINDALVDCAKYDPNETNPQYLFSQIKGRRPMNCTYCTSVEALVKLQFVEVVNDTDLVLIDNLDALQLMMFAGRNRTASKLAEAQQLELDAIRELNYGLRDKFPIEQFEVAWRPYGTADFSRVSGGFI